MATVKNIGPLAGSVLLEPKTNYIKREKGKEKRKKKAF